MESNRENFGGVKAKNSSEEAQRRWRRLCSILKNPKRRFRFTANLDKRGEAQAIKHDKYEKLRVAVLVSKAALQFIHGLSLRSEYAVPEEVKAAGFQRTTMEVESVAKQLEAIATDPNPRHQDYKKEKFEKIKARCPDGKEIKWSICNHCGMVYKGIPNKAVQDNHKCKCGCNLASNS